MPRCGPTRWTARERSTSVTHRRFTMSEQRWPATPEFTAVARHWNKRAIEILFEYVWSGYDLLLAEVLPGIDWTQVGDDVERDITEHLEFMIRRNMKG